MRGCHERFKVDCIYFSCIDLDWIVFEEPAWSYALRCQNAKANPFLCAFRHLNILYLFFIKSHVRHTESEETNESHKISLAFKLFMSLTIILEKGVHYDNKSSNI